MPYQPGSCEELLRKLTGFNRFDEDAVDRYNHKHSFLIFSLLSLSVLICEYISDPISCWSPYEFPDSWVNYTRTICWISNTYHVPTNRLDIKRTPHSEITYYQWVPLMLLLQAFLFGVPWLYWNNSNKSFGVNIHKMVKVCRELEYCDTKMRDRAIRLMASDIYKAASYSHSLGSWSRLWQQVTTRMAKLNLFWGRSTGNSLTASYIQTKILYILNILFQLYILSSFLSVKYWIFGWNALHEAYQTGGQRELARFPRVAICNFDIRALGGNIHSYTVQCALPVNLINEKIFIFTWFWLVTLGLCNSVSAAWWLLNTFPFQQHCYVRQRLQDIGIVQDRELNRQVSNFSQKYLRQDGCFILQMIDQNTDDVSSLEIIEALWQRFYKEEKCDCSVIDLV